MVLLALALAPAVVIIFYILGKDKYNKEPFKNLLNSFLLGVVSTIPAVIFQSLLSAMLKSWFPYKSILYYVWFAFIAVGLTEEGSKYIMLRWYAYRKKAFDEPL